MAPPAPPSTVPGRRTRSAGRPAVRGLATGGADGVSRVLTGLSAQLAHTMVLCGLPDVRGVPRGRGTPAR